MNHQCNTLSILGLGLAIGLTTGIFMFSLGLLAWLAAWGTDFMMVVESIYVGYEPTLFGSFLGGIYGFVDGFISGTLIAFFYNLYVCRCSKHDMQQA